MQDEKGKLERLIADLTLDRPVTDGDMRELLSPTPDASFHAFQAAEVPDALIRFLGCPQSIRADNKLEFAGRTLTNRPT